MRSPAAATSAVRGAGAGTSPARAGTLVCSASPARAGSRASAPRASITSRQPRAASARASASPSPREAPVRIATGAVLGMVPKLRPRAAAHHRESGLVLPADEPVLDRVHRRLGAVGEAELAEDVRDVGLHRALGDAELERDRLVRLAAGELGEDLELARGEVDAILGVGAQRPGAVLGR